MRIYLKRFLILVCLLFPIWFPLLAFLFLTGTETGKQVLQAQIEGFLSRAHVEAKIHSITADSIGVLELKGITGNHLPSKLSFQIPALKVQYALQGLLGTRALVTRVECELIKLTGKHEYKALEGFPDLPPFGCFADTQAVPLFETIRLERLEWRANASSSLSANVDKFFVDASSSTRNLYSASWKADLRFRDQSLFSHTFAGSFSLSQKNLEGDFQGSILGEPFQTDVQARLTLPTFSISGHLKPFSMDLSRFYRWLKPLWEKDYPLGWEGNFDLEGSWLFDSRVGFSGNLKAEIRKLQLILQGFMLQLLEINANCLYSQGKLSVTDKGSRFLGFPGTLNGTIQANFREPAEWNLAFQAPILRFEEMIASFPWALRYSIKIPEISGPASLSVQFSGVGPKIRANFALDDTRLRNPRFETRLKGKLEMSHQWPSPSQFQLQFSWEVTSGQPKVMKRVLKNGAPLALGTQPLGGFGVISGTGIGNCEFNGSFQIATQTLPCHGLWQGGICREVKLPEPFFFFFEGFDDPGSLMPFDPE